MSEIVYVSLSALWILGLSLILTVLAITGYMAGEIHQSMGELLTDAKISFFLNLGAILLSAGLAGLSGPGWEKILWGLLGMGFIANMVWDHIEKSRQRRSQSNP